MRKGLKTQGFTIVEVLIVIAVTGVLIISALALISGKQQITQFNQAINDIQSQVNQVINNVQTGYYTKSTAADFTCIKSAAGPVIDFSGSSEQGTNPDCTFVGRAMRFTTDSSYNIYTLVGLRHKASTSDDVSNIADAQPKALEPGDVDNGTLQYGLQPVKIYYSRDTSPPSIPTGVVAFVSSFDQASTGGSGTAGLYAISGTDLTSVDPVVINKIDASAAGNFDANTTSVTICFDGGTDLFAILTIGGNSSQLTTSLQTVNKSSGPAACT